MGVEGIMDLKKIKEIFDKNNLQLELFFTKKNRNNYESFSPNVSMDILFELKNTIKPLLEKYFDMEQVSYSPIGYMSETIEICNTEYVEDLEKILESFKNADKTNTNIDFNDLSFYCFRIKELNNSEDFDIKIFRKLTKFKKLASKGIVAHFSGNTLNKLEEKIIGLDGGIDLLVFNDNILILEHHSMERIFCLEEKFVTTASNFLEIVSTKSFINNFDNFKKDCLESKLYSKILTKMMSENIDIDRISVNFENVKKVIQDFNLDLQIDETSDVPHLIYSNKTQIKGIIRIMRDAYFESLINKEKGVNDKI